MRQHPKDYVYGDQPDHLYHTRLGYVCMCGKPFNPEPMPGAWSKCWAHKCTDCAQKEQQDFLRTQFVHSGEMANATRKTREELLRLMCGGRTLTESTEALGALDTYIKETYGA